MHPHKGEARASNRAKVKSLTGVAKHGRPHGDEAQDRKLVASMLKAHDNKKDGGRIVGMKSGGRLDKFARGGGTKKGAVNIAIVVPPGKDKGQDQGPGAMPPPPPPGLGGGPPPPAPNKPPGPPGGAMPMPIPIPVGGGGGGGGMPPPMGRKAGGRVNKYYKGGAITGVGRLEKVKKYGLKAHRGG